MYSQSQRTDICACSRCIMTLDRQCTYKGNNEALSRNPTYRGRAKVLHILYVCVRVCVAFAPYCIVCGLSGSATFSHIISLYVISVCKRVTLPPGLHPIAVKYIFHSFISGTILGERLSNIKCVFWFSLQNFRLYIVILRRIQRDIVMNICRA